MGWREGKEAKEDEHSIEQSLGSLGDSKWSPGWLEPRARVSKSLG